jgi:23S rRNA pseudouridine1911/1915/1917 synthase
MTRFRATDYSLTEPGADAFGESPVDHPGASPRVGLTAGPAAGPVAAPDVGADGWAGDAGNPGHPALAPHAGDLPADDDWVAELDMPDAGGSFAATEPAAELRCEAPPEYAGERLDKALARLFPAYSRARLQNWIEGGRVFVDGVVATVRQPVALGALIVVRPDLLPEQHAFMAEAVALDVVHEDAALVVLNKAAGLVVHPAAGNWSGTLLNGLLHRYGAAAAGLPRAGIVHRLDKDTSGLMVVARTLAAQTDLARQLQARTVKRRYLALVWGTPLASGVVEAPIGRDPRVRVRMAVVPGAAGKPARTHYRTLASSVWAGQTVSAVQCDLDTGRTHQIRVHLAHLGFPLLGDPLYGRARRSRSQPVSLPNGFARQALHAWQLGLLHPLDGSSCAWHAPLAPDMAALAGELGLGEILDDWFTRALADTAAGGPVGRIA